MLSKEKEGLFLYNIKDQFIDLHLIQTLFYYRLPSAVH